MASIIKSKEEKKNTSREVESFITKNRVALLSLVIVLALAALCVCVVVTVRDSARKKALSALDSIEYAYTKDGVASLSEDELLTRQNTALEALAPYLGKKNIVGVYANKLAADISFSKKEYAASLDYWLAVAEKGKKTYNAALGYYNAGVCCEELGNLTDAATYYETSSQEKDFVLITHALFNVARVKEQNADFEGAAQWYQKLVDEYPSDSWANVAQSRLVALHIEGKI